MFLVFPDKPLLVFGCVKWGFKKQIFTTFLNPQMKSESTDEINKLNYNNINIIAFMSSDNKPLQIILKRKYQRD